MPRVLCMVACGVRAALRVDLRALCQSSDLVCAHAPSARISQTPSLPRSTDDVSRSRISSTRRCLSRSRLGKSFVLTSITQFSEPTSSALFPRKRISMSPSLGGPIQGCERDVAHVLSYRDAIALGASRRAVTRQQSAAITSRPLGVVVYRLLGFVCGDR